MKLLIVEDSYRLRDTLNKGFTQLGYNVDTAQDGAVAISFINAYDYDVVVLDLMMPKVDGFDVLKHIKQQGKNCAVIILSAKEEVADKVKGLKLGADDYLAKPFSFDELAARVAALVRRANGLISSVVNIDTFTIDLQLKQVKVNQEEVFLTPHEYSILEYLILNRGRIVSITQIETAIYDTSVSVSKNTIETYISTIRKKLKNSGLMSLIQTKRSFGYSIP